MDAFGDIIFLKDSALSKFGSPVQQLLRQHFRDERVISRYFTTAWPPRSSDITSVYHRRKVSVPDLKSNIRHHIPEILTDSLRSAVENMILLLEQIVENEDGHIEQF